MNKGLVSIIMPSYNTGKFIEESINSVINQTYIDWELIIIDDCSTDNTEEIVKSFNDERIKFIKNDKNSGAAFSRNKALSIAKGRWMAFLDSDDLWDKTKLETQINFMIENNYSFSYTTYRHIDEESKFNGTIVYAPKKISKRKMNHFCYIGCLTAMYDKDMVGLVQIDSKIKKRNDYAIWLKVIKFTGNAYLCNQCLASYRIRSGSISRVPKFKLLQHHYKLFKISERHSTIGAIFFTCINVFYGILKKVFYVKKK